MEIIDDLQRDGLVIVRSDSRFAYGHDAVLLTDFVRAHAGSGIWTLARARAYWRYLHTPNAA